MAKPDPESALYRPFVFDADYAKIGKAALADQEPTPLLFDTPPDPKLVGEQAYVAERDRLERLARMGEGGYLSQSPWERIDAALPPGEEARQLERADQLRALHGGLSDAPDDGGAQATENGNRIPVRFTR
jgi:hypothetical protein